MRKAHFQIQTIPAKKIPAQLNERGYMRFAAIDFETADYGRDSACAVSVVEVEGTRIVSQYYSLIRPPRKEFIFDYIHGITWEKVRSQPVFKDVWSDFEPFLKRVDFIAAHNARFDIAVLAACCYNAKRALPQAPILDTVQLARRAWNIKPTRLPDVCSRFKIPLSHHDALSDAKACARIVIEAINQKYDFSNILVKTV